MEIVFIDVYHFLFWGMSNFIPIIKMKLYHGLIKIQNCLQNFFGYDDTNNKTKEELAKEEYNYIKSKDSWGGFHLIEIVCIIFGLSMGVYTDNGNNEFVRYSYSENLKDNAKIFAFIIP